MPGLLRGVVRTAAVAGTATAVGGRVRHRQERRWGEAEAAQSQPQQPASPTAAAAPEGGGESTIDQLKELAQLKEQGILTEEEFAAEKTKLLAG